MSAESGLAPAWVVGIDLGTTNTALAYAPGDGGPIATLPIPQVVGEGEVAARPGLASALYRFGAQEDSLPVTGLPWETPTPGLVVGEGAHRLGTRLPDQIVVSAKSWLCHPGVDRRARVLPWGSEAVEKISPVDAAAEVLGHLAAAWNAAHPAAPLATLPVVLAVPASFDEVARELTVEAARRAGLVRLRLLEEPQAALYAWVAAHADWRERLAGKRCVLVVDIGGGTTDFSLVRVDHGPAGVTLVRSAVGEHLLLGGDNMDLALARLAITQASGVRLDAGQWRQLTAACRQAKEELLVPGGRAEIPVALAGRGRSLLGSTIRVALRAEDAAQAIRDGFFPLTDAGAAPELHGEAGLAEIGLPYERDPAVTRHLAAFLAAAGQGWPDAVLFNGGALEPRALRDRLLLVLERWSGQRPAELAGADLSHAVARGAAAYGLALRGHLPRISGGSARAYYIGLGGEPARAVCVAPRGQEDGTTLDLEEPAFEVVSNEPVRFTLLASATRLGDGAGDVIEVHPTETVVLPPLTAVLRFGRKLESRRVPVRLHTEVTEVGTLDISLAARTSNHRWHLSFDLRAREASAAGEESSATRDRAETVVDAGRRAAAAETLRAVFAGGEDPVGLLRVLETALGGDREGWGIGPIRALFDELLELEPQRGRSAAHEARWFNLAGFLLRPGHGEERDGFRIERLWRLYDAGPHHPTASQVRSEWWSLWRRVAAGLTRVQQEVIHKELRGPLLGHRGRGKGRASRWKAGPHEVREMWLVVAALERLPQEIRRELFAAVATRVVKPGRASDAEIVAFTRLAARQLVAGGADVVVPAALVAPFVERLAAMDWDRAPACALALASASRLTGDVGRDLPLDLRERAAARLGRESAGQALARWPIEAAPFDAGQRALVVTDSLPVGLHLAAESGTGS